MFKNLANWFDSRTGYKALVHEALEEPIPGGAKWRYVFGSALSATFMIQLVTGLLLMTSYSPSSSTAWGSVWYIQNRMGLGWYLRGIHHFGSQGMVVLLVMHLVQVLWAGAYRAPREVNWWFGMALLFLTLGFSLTGYLLPWDQKGFWATTVATTIAGNTPVFGPAIQKVIVGGPDYGNQTLTRFYGLHVGVLPTLLVLCLAAHIALFRKHGVTPPRNPKGVGKFWPQQVFYDTVASVAVLGVLSYLVLANHGANLDAPADPASEYPARPEWYFLSLFQLLKKFPGELEVVGTIIVPGAIMTTLLALPLLDRIFPRKFAHFLACVSVFALIGGAGYLTYESMAEDARNATFQDARKVADATRDRALQLADTSGITPEGAGYLLMRDPWTRGQALAREKCLSCHYYDGKGQSTVVDGKPATSPQAASELKGFGSYEWVRGLLENPQSDRYFGKVPQCDGMATWKASSKLTPAQLDDVARFVATFAEVDDDTSPEEWAASKDVKDHPGRAAFARECAQCHALDGKGSWSGEAEGARKGFMQPAPDLYAYASTRWTSRMIKRPGSPHLYGYLAEDQAMPAFDAEQLPPNDLDMVVRFLKRQYVEPRNGAIAGE